MHFQFFAGAQADWSKLMWPFFSIIFLFYLQGGVAKFMFLVLVRPGHHRLFPPRVPCMGTPMVPQALNRPDRWYVQSDIVFGSWFGKLTPLVYVCLMQTQLLSNIYLYTLVIIFNHNLPVILYLSLWHSQSSLFILYIFLLRYIIYLLCFVVFVFKSSYLKSLWL